MSKVFNIRPVSLAIFGLSAILAGCASNIESKIKADVVTAKAVTSAGAVDSIGSLVSNDTKGTRAAADKRAQENRNRPVSMVASRPFLGGSRTQTIQPGEVLPPVLYSNFVLAFDSGSEGSNALLQISSIAERIQRATGVPVRVRSDVVALPNNTVASQGLRSGVPTPLPTNGQVSASIAAGNIQMGTALRAADLRWDGSVAGFLDHFTALSGLSWSYRDGSIIIERYITETFEVAALQSSQSFSFSLSGSSSGTAGGQGGATASNSSGMDVSETGKSEIMSSLGRTLSSIIASQPGSSVTLSDGSGSIIVTTTKDTMARVRQVMQQENASMLRSVQLQFDIYTVISNDASDFGINWNLLTQELGGALSGTSLFLTTPGAISVSGAGQVSANVIKDGSFGAGSSVILAALAKYGSSVQYRPVSIMTMNRQWARKTNLRQKGYLAETTPATATAGGSGGTAGLKSGSVTTGETFAVLPAIMNDGTVVLKFGLGLTDLLGLFDVVSGVGTSQQRIQTPEVSGTNDQGTVPLAPGEVLVLTGMSRTRSTDDRSTLGEGTPVIAGGSKSSSRVREEFIVVIRPVVL